MLASNRDCLDEPIGIKVEMRRWYTYYDAGRQFHKLWHTLLLALLAQCLLDGENPWHTTDAKPLGLSVLCRPAI